MTGAGARTHKWGRIGAMTGASTIAVAALLPGSVALGSPEQPSDELGITVLSSLPDFVTGGDALIQIDVDAADELLEVTVSAGGRDQTDAFEVDEAARTLTGLVEDLPLGPSDIEVEAGGTNAQLTVINHPDEGPLLAGEHEDPFICETETASIPVIGVTMGAPLDESCSVEPRVDYLYQSTTDSKLHPWPQGVTMYPGDLRFFTNDAGERLPFIVRMESGTVNRAIYRTTMLHDPLTESEPTPGVRPAGWSGAGVFMFGGGCPGGWYRQGATTGEVTNVVYLEHGFALMSSTLNVFGNNCNDLLASETAAMVKERFVERNGPLDYLMGVGSSGGSYQSLQTADNYPGILDGILISDTFPDVLSGTIDYITDAKLLHRYFQNTDLTWTDAERDAVTGFLNYDTVAQVAADQRTNPSNGCGVLPADLAYDASANPGGARCDVFSHAVNVYGTDPNTGMPRRPLDNVGIQYGFQALNDGVIDADQFLDLNEAIGGLDGDSNPVPERTHGDVEAIRAAYASGRVLDAGHGLAEIPIVDRRTFLDENEGGNIHASYHSHSVRQRLIEANGTADNLLSLMRDSTHPQFSLDVILGMDQWIRDIAADESDVTPLQRVIQNRPDRLRDGCYLRDGSDTFVEQPLDRDPGSICEQQYPSGSFPREVAGDSITAEVLKCQVEEPAREDYGVELTDAQWQRLLETFPEGVCDYTQPGVEQQDLSGTWLRFNPIPEPEPTDPPTDEPTGEPTDGPGTDPTDGPTTGPSSDPTGGPGSDPSGEPNDPGSGEADGPGNDSSLPNTGVTGALLALAAVFGLGGIAMAVYRRRSASPIDPAETVRIIDPRK